MDDVGRFLGGGSRLSHPIKIPFSERRQTESEPQAFRQPRQPNGFHQYRVGDGPSQQTTMDALKNMSEIDPHEIYKIYMDRGDRVNEDARNCRRKLKKKSKDLLPEEMLDKIEVTEHGGTMCLEMVKRMEKLGGEIREVPVSHYERKYGKSQFFKIKNLLRVFVDIPKLFFMLGR